MNFTQQMLDIQEKKLHVAVGHLGSYSALISYAIQALRGTTACSPEEVANSLEKRHEELTLEQDVAIFGKVKVA